MPATLTHQAEQPTHRNTTDRRRTAGMGAAIIAMMLGSTACAPDAAGTWRSTDSDEERYSEMVLTDDGDGKATLRFALGERNNTAEFEIDWRETDGDEVEIELECQGPCSELDFTMECEPNEDFDEMVCDGDRAWEDYRFEWRRYGW